MLQKNTDFKIYLQIHIHPSFCKYKVTKDKMVSHTAVIIVLIHTHTRAEKRNAAY